MDDAEAKNIISMGEATYGLQLVAELHQQGSEAELSEETTFANAKTMSKADEVENTTSVDRVTNALQLVEELHQQDDETGISVPFAELSNKVTDSNAETISEHDEVENVTSTGQATFQGQLVEDLVGQESETELTIPSVEVSKKLVFSETKPISKDDEVEIIILTDRATNDGLQKIEELHQDNETRFSDENVVANMKPMLNDGEIDTTVSTGQATNGTHLTEGLREDEPELGFLSNNPISVADTKLQVGTVSNSEVLMIEEEKATEEFSREIVEWEGQQHGKTNLKSTLNKRRTEIAEELEYLNAQTDQKLMRIEEIAKQEVAIGTEIAHMESQCSESKCRHAEFIDLFKLIVESQLPLSAHREIKLLIKKKDKKAQKFLSKALDLQFNMEARAKLKQTLQEERTELAKLVEDLSLQMHQKLKETDEVNKLEEEAVGSEITCMESQCSEGELAYTSGCRKRKTTHDGQVGEEELFEPDVRAKRMALNTGDCPQEGVHHTVDSPQEGGQTGYGD